MQSKALLSVLIGLLLASYVHAQNKKLPRGYEKEALAALAYFPELEKFLSNSKCANLTQR